MWSDWLVFCDYGFSVSALWCPLATPTVLLGFLLPWTWGISSQLFQQSAAVAPYLGQGLSPRCHPSWPWTWNSSSRPSCVCSQPPLNMTIDVTLPTRSTNEWAGSSPSLHEAKTSLRTNFTHQRTDTRSKKNYDPSARKKENTKKVRENEIGKK